VDDDKADDRRKKFGRNIKAGSVLVFLMGEKNKASSMIMLIEFFISLLFRHSLVELLKN